MSGEGAEAAVTIEGSGRGTTRWIRMLCRLGAFVDQRVPLGYEDETGFHFGTFPTTDGSR